MAEHGWRGIKIPLYSSFVKQKKRTLIMIMFFHLFHFSDVSSLFLLVYFSAIEP